MDLMHGRPSGCHTGWVKAGVMKLNGDAQNHGIFTAVSLVSAANAYNQDHLTESEMVIFLLTTFAFEKNIQCILASVNQILNG